MMQSNVGVSFHETVPLKRFSGSCYVIRPSSVQIQYYQFIIIIWFAIGCGLQLLRLIRKQGRWQELKGLLQNILGDFLASTWIKVRMGVETSPVFTFFLGSLCIIDSHFNFGMVIPNLPIIFQRRFTNLCSDLGIPKARRQSL